MTFDFTIGEYVEWSDKFAGFKPGVGKAAIPMDEIAAITYESTCGGAVVSVQSNSLDAVAKIPGHDRGRVDLKIEKRDRELALTVVNAVRSVLGDSAIDPHEAAADESKLVPHMGLILMGCGFLAVGVVMFVLLGILMDNAGYLWTGIGLALAGGSILGSAFADQNRLPRSTRPNGNLAMGIVMLCIGFGLMLFMGLVFNRHGPASYVWVGMGLALGGCSVLSSAWPKPRNDGESEAGDPPQKPIARRTDVLNGLSTPAGFQWFLGVINVLISLGAFAGVAYLFAGAGNGSDRTNLVFNMIPLTLAIATLISGFLMIVGARNMKSLRSYGLAVTGAIVCMLPTSPLWIITFIIGVWSISTLSKTAVKQEFRSAPVVEYASR